jgi:hypothetical protein
VSPLRVNLFEFDTLSSGMPLKPDLEAVIYRLLEAKFCSETASGVGKATSVLTMNSLAKYGSMGHGVIDKVKIAWQETLKTPEPEQAISIIAKSNAVTGISDSER